MKAYILTTAILFLSLTAAHIWRVTVEPNLLTEPFFLFTTLVSTGLALWAATLLRQSRTPPRSEA